MTESAENLDLSLRDAYREFDTALRVRQAKVCCVIALTLVPLCIGLDYLIYPELLWPMLKARLLCDVGVLPCYLAVFRPFGRRHIKLLGNIPAAFPGMAICWMIYLSEGILSPYYAGLNIVMVAVILLIPYTLVEGVMISMFLMLCYGLACVCHRYIPPTITVHGIGQLSGARTLINNLYFLGMTSIMGIAASYYSSRRRFMEFCLRHDLDVNNRELALTVRKLQETEVQLVQSEKMNALGKLSAGLLHEINNPLNFTFMALQVAEQEAADNEGLRETLADINQGMGRIRSVVSDLRAFAYPSKLNDAEIFILEEALTTATRLTAHELQDIQVRRTDLEQVRVLGSKTQIVHVFMNLLVNAAHALRSKGKSHPAEIAISTRTESGRLAVAVRDNGMGIPAANLPRLLEPFFTTKQPGEGTGLGLSISHTIVKNHGGTIKATSEVGQWTEMVFDLPLAA